MPLCSMLQLHETQVSEILQVVLPWLWVEPRGAYGQIPLANQLSCVQKVLFFGAKEILTQQLTRCWRTGSFSLRSGIALADAYAGLRTPGFCLREVLIATLLLKMNN